MSPSSLEIRYTPSGIDREGIKALLSRFSLARPGHVVFIGPKTARIKQ